MWPAMAFGPWRGSLKAVVVVCYSHLDGGHEVAHCKRDKIPRHMWAYAVLALPGVTAPPTQRLKRSNGFRQSGAACPLSLRPSLEYTAAWSWAVARRCLAP
ncbi:hypothetical protein B0T25DRAFT_111622 [Lasiosphaeria hispida]|uniref:Secreted protein n=1 Tax=Lasiosphaeria hispida TaxID=260671 RepID=A0AAJ0HRH9_9PEZI|nr:hypothetical protein B0T25DRAFT_111622 [Lasiosphaeria hispida]